MKNFAISGFWLFVISILAACSQAPKINLKECDTFVAAKPVWA